MKGLHLLNMETKVSLSELPIKTSKFNAIKFSVLVGISHLN